VHVVEAEELIRRTRTVEKIGFELSNQYIQFFSADINQTKHKTDLRIGWFPDSLETLCFATWRRLTDELLDILEYRCIAIIKSYVYIGSLETTTGKRMVSRFYNSTADQIRLAEIVACRYPVSSVQEYVVRMYCHYQLDNDNIIINPCSLVVCCIDACSD
jgi:hypothetical protein